MAKRTKDKKVGAAKARPAAEPETASEPAAAKHAKPARGADATTALPGSRHELLELHRETRRRRNQAAHGSDEHKAAIDLIGRIEVEIARIEREMDPPRM